MPDALALLWLPFVVAACLVAIHTHFGIQVLARNIVFVDLALAQIAALGATVAFMLGHPAQGAASYAYSLAFTLGAAWLLAFTRQWAGRIPQEALIGVIYVVAAAAAFLLVDRAPQGAEHIKQILTGNILTVGGADLALIVPLYAAIGLAHFLLRHRLYAPAPGRASWWWDFLFYASFGLVVTSSVALAGVLLVFSFLIIPAAIGVLYAHTPGRQLAIGWAAGCAASLVGLAASYGWDLPTGASMVCVFGAALALGAPAASADEALAKAKGCTACHDVTKKLVGPPYKEVAKKYKADKDAPAAMAASVLKGSQGKWGPIPMPPNKVTDDEAKKLVAWILTL